jgi:hypothetical protein
MKTVLFSFADDEIRDQFLGLLRDAAETIKEPEDAADLIKGTLNTVVLDPPIKEDHERMVAIWITGQKMHEGPLSEMQRVFDQELGAHSGSVVMKELRGGEWLEIRARRQQA